MVDDRRMKIGVTSPTTLTIPPTPLPLVRSSNCRSRLLARNHPVQEEVVGCEIRCGACATGKNGLEWPLAEFVRQRHAGENSEKPLPPLTKNSVKLRTDADELLAINRRSTSC